MLSSSFGSKSIDQLLDLLSNAGETKKTLNRLIKKEKAVQSKLEELYNGKTAEKFHADFESDRKARMEDLQDLKIECVKASELNAQKAEEQEKKRDEDEARLHAYEDKLESLAKELEDQRFNLSSIEESLADKNAKLDRDLEEALSIKSEYEAKLADLKSKFESI